MLNDTNFKFICVLYTGSIPTEPDLSSLFKIHYYLVFNQNVHGLSSFISDNPYYAKYFYIAVQSLCQNNE